MKKNLANIITTTRLIGSLLMIPLEVLSNKFYILYTYLGISDVLDGFIARKTKTTSTLGSKLDSISDLLFYTIMMIKLLPKLLKILPSYIWLIIQSTLAIRCLMYIFVAIKEKKIMSNHTIFNKATGLLMFLIPFMIKTNYFIPFALFVSTFALFAALYEIKFIRRS